MLRFVFAIPMGLGFSSPRKTPFNSAEYRCLQSQYARISCGTCCRVRAILIIDRKSTATCNRSFDISYANSANIAYRMPESVQRLEPPEIVAFQRARVLQCDLTYTLPSIQVYTRTLQPPEHIATNWCLPPWTSPTDGIIGPDALSYYLDYWTVNISRSRLCCTSLYRLISILEN
jgi:hypothetical protein